ncbi:Arc family DNA-binding protein [Paraburkholderia tropica]|uniref:Arc family DNA-binding protein n=1 Tax=Paraburkholderia tropica TaxID=92647 RepID=UPI003AFB693C
MKGAKCLPQVNLRLDQKLKDELTEAAQRNFRSLNSEITVRLTATLEAEKGKAPNA